MGFKRPEKPLMAARSKIDDSKAERNICGLFGYDNGAFKERRLIFCRQMDIGQRLISFTGDNSRGLKRNSSV